MTDDERMKALLMQGRSYCNRGLYRLRKGESLEVAALFADMAREVLLPAVQMGARGRRGRRADA